MANLTDTKVYGNLLVNGTVTATSFNAVSKRDAKDNIRTYTESALEKINQVDVVNFTFKDDEKKVPHVGFIADDTDALLAGPNHDHMDLGNSVGLLIKAVQELSQRNGELEKRIEKLENSFLRKIVKRIKHIFGRGNNVNRI